MKTLPSMITLVLALATVQASAQTSTQEPGVQGNAQERAQSTVLQGHEVPVTVNWGQPSSVPNVADYQITIADLDRNGDRQITRGEVPATHALSSEFKLVDRNRDGRITEQELANWR